MTKDVQQEGPLPPATLLLVDDEANILASLRRLFRPLGYTILTAESGAAGLEILENEPVDIIISDMRMPQMDGAQFLEQVAGRWPQTVRFILTGYADLNSTIDAINKGQIYGYFSKPWEDNEIRLAVQHALEQQRLRSERDHLLELTARQNEELKELNAILERRVEARTEELRQANMFLELAYEQLKESYFAAIPVFANLVELREGSQGGHSKRVAELAREIARVMEVDAELERDIYHAGLLHDIGKLGLPDTLIRTPCARLSTTQRKVVEKHPLTGQAILMGMEPLQAAGTIIRHHHETFDGKGYPARLVGAQIPLGARILAVANDYDGLRFGTLLDEELSAMDAREFILQRAGRRYDPNVVEALTQVLEEREHGQEVVHELRLNPDELKEGMVLSRDLVSHDGILLLSKGYRLTNVLIGKLKSFAHDDKVPFIVHVLAQKEEGEDA